jgi:TonB family protein
MQYKRISILTATLLLAGVLCGQTGPSSPHPDREVPATNSNGGQTTSENNDGPVEILSDTKGVDLHSYVVGMAQKFGVNWIKRLAAVGWSPYSPKNKKGTASVDFHVLKDGRIVDVQLAKSSGDAAQDRAATSAVSDSSPLPPLPADFPCQYVALRHGFVYTPYHDPSEVPAHEPRSMAPCVTSKITFIGPVAISVSPISAQVVAGGKLQILGVCDG